MARMLKFTSAVALVLAALAGVAAARTQHVCLQYGLVGAGSFFYEITADDSQTKFDRYDMTKNPPQLVDSNVFGPLSTPNLPDGSWDAGVAFANELRSRGAWANNNEAVTGARCDDDTWRFETTLFGHPLELTFSAATCAVFPTAAPTPAQETLAPAVPTPALTAAPTPAQTAAPTPAQTAAPTPAQATLAPAVPEPVPATNAPGTCLTGVPATPGSQPTQPGDQPPAPVTTSILSGNVGPGTDVSAAFSGSSAWVVAAASVATACVAVLA